MDKKHVRRDGFTLVELLIVVSIILILAVIATPAFIGALQTSREASAVATISRIYQAQMIYMAANNGFGTLGTLAATGALDNRFAEDGGTPTLGGYTYSITLSDDDGAQFYIQADPVSSTSGRYDYYAGPDGVVRYRTTLGGVEAGAAVE
jgi:prepilin-type N-terminal cleavage/methylation domain-containing protein